MSQAHNKARPLHNRNAVTGIVTYMENCCRGHTARNRKSQLEFEKPPRGTRRETHDNPPRQAAPDDLFPEHESELHPGRVIEGSRRRMIQVGTEHSRMGQSDSPWRRFVRVPYRRLTVQNAFLPAISLELRLRRYFIWIQPGAKMAGKLLPVNPVPFLVFR